MATLLSPVWTWGCLALRTRSTWLVPCMSGTQILTHKMSLYMVASRWDRKGARAWKVPIPPRLLPNVSPFPPHRRGCVTQRPRSTVYTHGHASAQYLSACLLSWPNLHPSALHLEGWDRVNQAECSSNSGSEGEMPHMWVNVPRSPAFWVQLQLHHSYLTPVEFCASPTNKRPSFR